MPRPGEGVALSHLTKQPIKGTGRQDPLIRAFKGIYPAAYLERLRGRAYAKGIDLREKA